MILNDDERLDDLQHNNLKIIQKPKEFCFGCDAVELANFVTGEPGSLACDLGAGNGIISVLLSAKKGFKVTAVEIQESAANLCRKNSVLNGEAFAFKVENIRMQEMKNTYQKGSFDIVVTNPPYSKNDGGKKSVLESKAIARHEILVTLSEVIEVAAHLLKFGGKFYIVHQTQRLSEVLTKCAGFKLEPKVLQILTPSKNKPPHLFLLSCTMGGRPGLTVLPERLINAFSV